MSGGSHRRKKERKLKKISINTRTEGFEVGTSPVPDFQTIAMNIWGITILVVDRMKMFGESQEVE
jgi:hypothetical protein